ncbi:oligoribonuclease-like isoform X1 [Lycium ferocissimum]|uniref:oligoribonuclease-like isoform X1 n=1 Tax=Lycium ferocissimum TaxID=112874 RepID=UPI0028153390|nr:oligoribonuclease-like isoform X1 [Lycium ferocissimum]XP_059305112.1 oligoribonuclease-like isoform X1 [Lycium ferocissimum]
MNQLSNAFSLLNLDVADSQDETQIEITNGDADRVKGKGKENGTDGSPGEMKVLEHEKGDQKLESVGGECKLPLVWIDLEMTGLNIEVDRILEIACIVTNGNLMKSIEGPDLVIHQAKECLDNMGEWCQEHHAASGLTEKVLKSTVTEEEAEKQVIEFVKRNIGTYTPLLAGNSVYVDFQFLKKYMPNLASLFSHVLVDVSSVKALCVRWYPRDKKKAPQKESKHRAMDDIKESIAELKYYKEHIFKASKSNM